MEDFMISPNYMCFTILVDNKIRIMGNVEYANKIVEMTKKYLRQGLNLYDTQEKIRNHIFEKLGVDWYEKVAKLLISSSKMNTRMLRE